MSSNAPKPNCSLHIKIDTWLKESTAQSVDLPSTGKYLIKAGTVLPIVAYAAVAPSHFKLTFGKDSSGQQIMIQERNTWFVYAPAVELHCEGKAIAASATHRAINADGLHILKTFEGLRLTAYQDSVGVWTIGYGTTTGVFEGQIITPQQAASLLKKDLNRFEQAVTGLVKVPLTEPQFSALVCFAYNVGEGALAESTLLRFLNQGHYRNAANQFLHWNRAGSQVVPELTRRRNAERSLFLEEDFGRFV